MPAHGDGGRDHKRWLAGRHGDMAEPVESITWTAAFWDKPPCAPKVPGGQLRGPPRRQWKGHDIDRGHFGASGPAQSLRVPPSAPVRAPSEPAPRGRAPDTGAHVNEASLASPQLGDRVLARQLLTPSSRRSGPSISMTLSAPATASENGNYATRGSANEDVLSTFSDTAPPVCHGRGGSVPISTSGACRDFGTVVARYNTTT